MTLRNLVRQVLVAVGALRRDQHGLATSVGRLVTAADEHSHLLDGLHLDLHRHALHLNRIERQITEQGESIMTRNEDQAAELRTGLAQLSVDLGELATRIEAKIDAAGSPDVDLSAELSTLRDFSTQVDALVVEPAPEPTP